MFLINNILTFFIFISCPQHFGETEDFAKKNNGETEDFGQKNFGVNEKCGRYLSKINNDSVRQDALDDL